MNAIEIKDLTKNYSGFSLENLNLTLPSGCIMGLVGENGAGKSTTIKLILDMIHKDSGSITRCNGRVVSAACRPVIAVVHTPRNDTRKHSRAQKHAEHAF